MGEVADHRDPDILPAFDRHDDLFGDRLPVLEILEIDDAVDARIRAFFLPPKGTAFTSETAHH
jgi:hypothetical protein